jgi:hypothetical protein
MLILCITALLIMKRWLWRVRGPIIVVGALTILEMRLWHLRNDGIPLINALPSGLPLPALPHFSVREDLIAPALAYGTNRLRPLDRQQHMALRGAQSFDERHPLRVILVRLCSIRLVRRPYRETKH